MGFATDAIHAGQQPDPTTGAIITPIYQTSTYVQAEIGKHKGYEYARTQNPTRAALEANIAALERGVCGIAFASGLAAINATLTLLKSGNHVVASSNLYGGTFRLFVRILATFGLEFSFVDTSNINLVEAAIQSSTRMIFIETPTNPTMTISDLAAISRIAQAHRLRFVVDNTFMSPYFQRPIELGADIVIHSTTKFLNGHSDSIGGMVVVKDPEEGERLAFIQNAAGAILSPFDAWLILRGTKTLAVRMRQHDANGRAIARFLGGQRQVQKIYYPGLADHPQHELAQRQMSGFGSMIAFELGSLEKANTLLKHVRLCSLAESLGGVETLISHPATMTHASVPREDRIRLGITDGLVRISVGIEDVEDIITDLEQALSRL
ncbi:MAG: PLP-dependent transferase [Acidobacteria bacterium]|nr:PLP-dependent transferase [Acidobacteriota bacterium]MBI3655377.1 PLP-dependent transferase [Acidobacteriota bacterium]